MTEKEQAGKVSSSEVVKEEPAPKRVRLDSTELKEATEGTLPAKWKDQDVYIDYLETKLNSDQNSNSELVGLRESEEKLKQQQQESTRRENVLVMRLATKEHEVQDLLTQIHDMKQAQNPSTIQIRSTLLDPAVNLLFQRMKTELNESKEKLEQAQSDLGAWKFTADSVTGKKLMAKCRMLIQENQELGRQLSQGRVAQLEAELALQKKYSDELKNSQDELNGFVIQLDEEVEGMQSTIMTLQQQLKTVKQQLTQQTEHNHKLRTEYEEQERALQSAKLRHANLLETKERVQADNLQTDHLKNVSDGLCPSTEQESPRKLPPNNVTSSSSLPTSFSISNILLLDTPKQEHTNIMSIVVPKLENGQEGGTSGQCDPSPNTLEPSDTQPLVSKGIPDGIGTDVNAFNVSAMN